MIKYILALIVPIIIVSTACSQKIISNKEKKLFEFHFAVMDSAARVTPNDTLVNVLESIAFMESKTGIEASTDGSLIGRLACTKGDLLKWHEWYDKNLGKNRKRLD